MRNNSNLETARKHCANWTNGNCLGGMISVRRQNGKKPSLSQWIDIKKVGRQCTVNTGCTYFNNLVVPAISILP